jgi:hypothetical protein
MHVDVARLKAWGPRARAERTPNMDHMFVTLEVSKLSGWLKRLAFCRVEGRACDAGKGRCEPGGGRACGVVAAHKRHAWGPTLKRLGAKGTRGAHVEHVKHGRDAGGVEAQRLVEGRRALPSRRGGHAMRGGEVRAGRPGVVAAHERHAREWPDSRLGGQGHARSAQRT